MHRSLALMAAVILWAPGAALAWSNQGHMITGAIAYDDLAQADPSAAARVEALMAAHPDKARFDAKLAGYAGAARSRRLFELMARWPDDVRGTAHDRPAWHYWLRPIVSTSDPVAEPPALLAATTGEAREAWRLALATAADVFAPASERAIALCWLFHLAGDIQQPLHAATLLSKRFPLSDRAGESAFIRPSAGRVAVDLHGYWDGALGNDEDDDANVEAKRIELERAWPRGALPELNGRAGPEAFSSWADESFALARRVVYEDGRFEGAASAAAAQPPPPGYAAARASVGARRIALGGHRIADGVRQALDPPRP